MSYLKSLRFQASPGASGASVSGGAVSDRPPAHGGAIPSLTGIRGAAALWVLLHHFEYFICDALGLARRDLGNLSREGFRGVDLFFVLSGFILMHSHAWDFRRPTIEVTKRFYLARMMRVYPLNAVVLFALLAVVSLLPDFVAWERREGGPQADLQAREFSAGGFVQSLLLAQTWSLAKLGEWNGPAWTLSAEVFGYFLFPVLAAVLIRQASAVRCALLAVASLAALTLLLAALGHADNNPSGLLGLARMLSCFCAGMCLARCHQTWPWSPRAGSALAAASIVAILVIPHLREVPGLSMAPLLMVFAFAGLVLGLAFQRGAVDWFMRSPPLMLLGKISFSLYIVHYIPSRLYKWMVEIQLPGLGQPGKQVLLATVLAVCFLLALATYRFVEQPFQRLGRRLARA